MREYEHRNHTPDIEVMGVTIGLEEITAGVPFTVGLTVANAGGGPISLHAQLNLYLPEGGETAQIGQIDFDVEDGKTARVAVPACYWAPTTDAGLVVYIMKDYNGFGGTLVTKDRRATVTVIQKAHAECPKT